MCTVTPTLFLLGLTFFRQWFCSGAITLVFSKAETVHFILCTAFVKALVSIKHFSHLKEESRVYLDVSGFNILLAAGLNLNKKH